LEFALYNAVCNSEVPLDEARSAIQTDWVAAYNKYAGLLNKYSAEAGAGN
jgi:hypothetical protein